jgi:hypothetical protein
MLKRLRRLRGGLHGLARMVGWNTDAAIAAEVRRRYAASANPLTAFGRKVFSQSDEDGLIAEVLRRMGIERGIYCEFGVGDGLECNTLALAAQGWRGCWISGQDLAFDAGSVDPSFFRFHEVWVDLDNVVELYRNGVSAFGAADADVLSFDLDSRDLFFLAALLEAGARPALAVAEYNARFAPPIRWSMPPDDARPWRGTDYFGASLASLAHLFESHGYRLVACNAASGANAFFIDERRFEDRFADVPRDVATLFEEPFYRFAAYGHPSDPRTVLRALQIGAAIHHGTKRPEWVPTLAQDA